MTEKFSVGQLVSFSEKRGTLRYKLAPYNEKARDRNAIFTEGSIDFSQAEGAIVNVEHDQFRPIGKLSNFESKPDGLYVTVTLADTTLGRDTFTEAKEGLRTGISMELSEMTPATGQITSAILSGAGICVNPALGSARLVSAFSEDEIKAAALEAVDALHNAVEGLETALNKTSEAPAEEDSNESVVTDEITPESSQEEEELFTKKEVPTMENSAIPTASNGSTNLSLTPQTIAQAYANKDVKLATTLAEAGLVGQADNMFALAGVTSTAHTANVEQSQWLGQLWNGKSYVRKYVNLVSTKPLTSWKVEGWKFTTKPAVGDYAGDLTEIPTNVPVTTHYSEEAERLAGGWKLDRKYRDFGNTEFISSFFAAATEDYARKSDRKVLDFIVANATTLVDADAVEGENTTAARIITGSMAMIDFADPAHYLIGTNAAKQFAQTSEFDNFKFLSQSFGWTGGTVNGTPVVVSTEIDPDAVYVIAKDAITFFELPGTPIQVSALDVARGGEDEALFGYYALILNDARGILRVDTAAV